MTRSDLLESSNTWSRKTTSKAKPNPRKTKSSSSKSRPIPSVVVPIPRKSGKPAAKSKEKTSVKVSKSKQATLHDVSLGKRKKPFSRFSLTTVHLFGYLSHRHPKKKNNKKKKKTTMKTKTKNSRCLHILSKFYVLLQSRISRRRIPEGKTRMVVFALYVWFPSLLVSRPWLLIIFPFTDQNSTRFDLGSSRMLSKLWWQSFRSWCYTFRTWTSRVSFNHLSPFSRRVFKIADSLLQLG